MVMVSDLGRARFVDASGQTGRLLDFVVDLAVGDYPIVVQALYRHPSGARSLLPWDAVDRSAWQRKRELRVPDFGAGADAPLESLDTVVLVQRDILDALVIDTEHRQALRANDVWLEEVDGRMAITAVDTGPWAIIRRLGRGLLGRGLHRHLLDWRWIEFLRGDPTAAAAGRDHHQRVQHLPPAEIARLADALPYLHAAELLTLLPDPIAADALEVMTQERQLQVFEELDDDQSSRLLALMAPDVAADLVGRLLPDDAESQLHHLPDLQQGRILELLRYPEDTAGGIMTNEIVVVPGSLSVAQARPVLAPQMTNPDFVYYVFVVDGPETRRLRGILTLRDLFVAKDEARLEAIMRPNPVTVGPLDRAIDAARRLTEAHFAAVPVVNESGTLLGAITVDAAMAQLAPTSWHEQAPRVFS